MSSTIIISSSSFILFAAVAIILGLYYTGFFTKPVDCVTSNWSACAYNTESGADEETRTITQHPNSKGKQCGALTQSCIVPPFTVGEDKSTDPHQFDTINYLDRQSPLCTGEAINNYQFKKTGTDSTTNRDMAHYLYNCSGNLNVDSITKNKQTSSIGYNFADYDSTIMSCGTDEVLGNVKAEGGTFHYDCLKSKDPLICRSVTTDHSNSLYDFHIKCNSDEALSRTEFNYKDGKGYYTYTCCKKK